MKSGISSRFRGARNVLVLAAVVGWVSIPLFDFEAKAGGVPILVRNANLVSPTGSINPHGAAVYQLYESGQRELEVEIEDVSAIPAGAGLNATINDVSVGQIILDVDQRGRLKLRTEDGQAIPVVNAGDVVKVLNGGTVLVSGIFGGGPSPSPSVSPTPSPTGSPTPGPTASPSPSPTPSPNNGLFAALTGPTTNGVVATGFAEFELHSSRTELEVRVRQVNLPIGTFLSVFVDNDSVGSLVLSNNGEGRLRLRSDNGQSVPAVTVGSTIRIQNEDTVILSGVFSGFASPTPSPSPTVTPGGTPSPTPTPGFGRSFEAKLRGSATLANGEFKVNLNTSETQATIFGEFHNLASNQTGARIETTTGTPVVIYSFGVVGTLNGNFASVTIPVSPAMVQQLRTGLWSAVVTTLNNPAGEIAGQITARSKSSDFDGDGQSDVAVFRPSTGTWFSLNNSGFTVSLHGSSTDKVVSADYDGDGKTDTAVYKPSSSGSTWQIVRSSDGGMTTESFGVLGDIPVRGDFDGDGRNDLAVFRPSNSSWYIRTSGSWCYTVRQFGAPGDIPIPGDLDGDGRDDITVFRPSQGKWYWLGSAQPSYNVTQFGVAGDIPVRGDFDGDGKNDLAVFRPSNGTWYTLSPVSGFRVQQFGVTGDVPVPADYDNDNKADIAVFRPSNGNWYFIRSSDMSFQIINFGVTGDIPTISQ